MANILEILAFLLYNLADFHCPLSSENNVTCLPCLPQDAITTQVVPCVPTFMTRSFKSSKMYGGIAFHGCDNIMCV